MGQEKGLYGKQKWWNEKPLILHGAAAEPNQNPMVFPEGEFMRVVGEIKGNLVGCVGNFTITIKGKLYGEEVVIDTLVVVAAGLAKVLGTKLVDIRGFDEITGSVVYVDGAGLGVTYQVYVGVPYK